MYCVVLHRSGGIHAGRNLGSRLGHCATWRRNDSVRMVAPRTARTFGHQARTVGIRRHASRLRFRLSSAPFGGSSCIVERPITGAPHRALGFVLIGRNEGERLLTCFRSVAGKGGAVVYVDSGSTDGSLERMKSLGAETVLLAMDRPFTAARARNTGF